MTFLGKIFSALVLILSVVFMALALAVNASHRNWRDVVMEPGTGLKAKVEEVERNIIGMRDRLQASQEALAREQAARRTSLAALQTQLDQAQQNLQTSEAAVQQLEAKNTELAQLDKSRAEELQRITAENSQLRSQIRTEQEDRDTLFAQTLLLTDQMNTLRSLLDVERERNEQLIAQVDRFVEVLEAKGINVNDPIDGAPPERNGVVLVVHRPSDLVEVSIGYDDGLREGHLLDVTRSGQYLGKLRVRKTEPDRAVAEILPEYRTGIIKERDRVDTSVQ